MSPEKFEQNFPILDFPYNIRICTNIAHTNSLHPPIYHTYKLTSGLSGWLRMEVEDPEQHNGQDKRKSDNYRV